MPMNRITIAAGSTHGEIRAVDLRRAYIGRVITADVRTSDGVYQLRGVIAWITFAADEVRIGVEENPDDGPNDWEFACNDRITLIPEA